MTRQSTRFLGNGKVISRVNDLELILQGRQAMSWLAGQSYELGMETPAIYKQGRSGRFLKLDSETLIVFGKKLAKKVEADWEKAVPDGVVLHRLDKESRKSVGELVRHLA